MSELRTGLDLVHVPRIIQMAERYGDRFYEMIFTPHERAYCLEKPAMIHKRMAGRWAAKEAVVKALGTGWHKVGYKDAEIIGETAWIASLAASGLDAIEAFHSEQDAVATKRYLALAIGLGIQVSGGSDFHGDPQHGPAAPGAVSLPPEQFDRLKSRWQSGQN